MKATFLIRFDRKVYNPFIVWIPIDRPNRSLYITIK